MRIREQASERKSIPLFYNQATTVMHLGQTDFDAFEIMLPDTELLDAFDAITTPMVEQIVSNSIENKRLAIMRDALLPKLMSGEIDVSDIQL